MITRLAKLTAAQEELARAMEDTIARTSPLGRVQELDNAGQFDRTLHAALARQGVFALGVPEGQGGGGGGPPEQIVALQTAARLAGSMGIYLVVHFLLTNLLRDHATQDQQERFLRPLLRGDAFGCFCLTEAGGGTDILAAMQTRARRDGDGWVLSGSKLWVSGGDFSDFMIVLARTGEHRTRGVTMFALPSGTPGITCTRQANFAIHGYPTCEVVFDEVGLPADAVLGTADLGFMQVLGALNGERVNAAAAVNGIGRGALEATVRYAGERQAFGRPLGQFQALQHRMAMVGIALESAWMLTQEAARRHGGGEPADIVGSMAKYASSKAAVLATDVGMEVMGAAGFDLARPMQRFYRDCRLHVFAPLNNDMVLNYVAEHWLGLPRSF